LFRSRCFFFESKDGCTYATECNNELQFWEKLNFFLQSPHNVEHIKNSKKKFNWFLMGLFSYGKDKFKEVKLEWGLESSYLCSKT